MTILMEIGKFMIPLDELISCDHMDTVEKAVELMAKENVGSIVVVKAGEIIGIVTSGDILKILAEKHAEGLTFPIGSITSRDPETVLVSDHLNIAIEKMADIQTHHLLVRHEGRYVGIISSFDIVREKAMDIRSHPWARG